MREFVLLLCDVVGLQRCRGDFDGVGEDLLALLNLPGFVGDGLFFVFDLRNGMTRLRRIEDDAGTELRLRCGLECRHESDGECGEDYFPHGFVPFFRRWFGRTFAAVRLYCCAARISLWSCARRSACGLHRASRSFFLASRVSISSLVNFSPVSILEEPAVSGSIQSLA